MPAVLSRLAFWAQVAGIAATGWVIWVAWAPPHMRGNLSFRIVWTAGLAIGALAWSAIMAIALILIRIAQDSRAAPPAFRPSAAAVWFAPATLLLHQFTPTEAAAGLVLIVSATRLLCAQVESDSRAPQLDRPMAWSFLIASGLQMACALVWMEHRLAAAGLLAFSTALLTSITIATGAWSGDRPPSLPRSVLGLALTVLLAMMAGRLPGIGDGGPGSANDPSGTSTVGQPAQQAKSPASKTDSPGAPNQQTRAPELPPVMQAGIAGDYAGVILWPEIKPVTMLVAPASGGIATRGVPSHPLTIPFTGEYWLFRFPFLRPPPNSAVQRGTPTALSFKTTDHARLNMEAHHRLEQPIPLSCCSRLLLTIRNADPYAPRTVSLEVVLIDRKLLNTTQSLGTVAVASIPAMKDGEATAVPETLDYRFQGSTRIDKFDEIKVVFHRTMSRIDKSARVAIERFVLVPRGTT
ncbi:MAG: hypothetical protein ACRD8O_03385 [Bryobacteraceae bacterium]